MSKNRYGVLADADDMEVEPQSSSASADKNAGRPPDSQKAAPISNIDWFTNGETGIVTGSPLEPVPSGEIMDDCPITSPHIQSSLQSPSASKKTEETKLEKFKLIPVTPPT